MKDKAPEFYKTLSKWIKCDLSYYLLFGSIKNKLTSSQITKLLNNIFDKRVSVDFLRHIYLTDKYGKVQAEMTQDSEDMSHSLTTQAEYIKK